MKRAIQKRWSVLIFESQEGEEVGWRSSWSHASEISVRVFETGGLCLAMFGPEALFQSTPMCALPCL